MITYDMYSVDENGRLQKIPCEFDHTPQTPLEFCNMLSDWAHVNHKNTVYYCFMTALDKFNVIFAHNLMAAIVAMEALGIPDYAMVEMIRKTRLYFDLVVLCKRQKWIDELKTALGSFRSEIAVTKRILHVMPHNLRLASETLISLLGEMEKEPRQILKQTRNEWGPLPL
jgi:hypothetical protein